MASGMASGVAVSCIGGMVGKASFGAFNTGGSSKLKLMSSAASETADGTEISGGSYPAGGITYTASSTWGAGAYASQVASITNSGASISQTNMPAATTTSASIYDSTPTRWWWGDLSSSVTTNAGDTLTFNTSSITCQLNM